MALKIDDPGEELTVVRRWSGGLTWMAHPNEDLQQASHALQIDDTVWLIDPIDVNDLDEELDDLGTVAGVVVLTNSHGRDADELAARHGVAIHIPRWFDDLASDFQQPVERFDGELAETGFGLIWSHNGSVWREGALYHPGRQTLVAADVLGTGLFSTRRGQLELFPFLRFSPPGDDLGDLPVERILVGHEDPIFEDPGAALAAALDVAPHQATAGVISSLPTFVRVAASEIRG